MKREILEQLNQAQADHTPCVTLTALSTGSTRFLSCEAIDRQPSDLRQAIESALASDRSAAVETGEGRVFINVFNPPLTLIIVGAVHIAQPLSQMAVLAGYDVTVVDPRSAFATSDRFPGIHLVEEWPDEALDGLTITTRTAVVTLTHDPKLDDPALDRALNSKCFYIGSLGSKKTHSARLTRLEGLGHGAEVLARINGPVGLAIGAKSPAEIAVSILAQMTEALRGQPSS